MNAIFFIFQFPYFAEFTNIIEKGYVYHYKYINKTKEEVKIIKIKDEKLITRI